MSQKRLNDNSPGQLKPIIFKGENHFAFVPNPLPPELTLDLDLVNALSNAERALGKLSGLGWNMQNPQLLSRPFLNREAVLSSKIEGTQSDITDLYVYQAGQQLALPLPEFGSKTRPSQEDTKEVNNYVEALEYGLKRLKELPISRRFICELHEILMSSVRGNQARPGELRNSQVWIGKPNSTINNADYVPPPPDDMERAFNELEKYIHVPSEYPLLMRVGMIHYQFEAIHPFHDGNGRIGRLLIILLLVEWEVLPKPILYLSAFFERNRDEYLDLLQAVGEKGEWKEWLLFFLKGVKEESLDAGERAIKLIVLQTRWKKQLQDDSIRTSGLGLNIVDSLFDQPITYPTLVQKRFEVTHAAASRALKRLEEMGILREAYTKQNRRIYVANKILGILDE